MMCEEKDTETVGCELEERMIEFPDVKLKKINAKMWILRMWGMNTYRHSEVVQAHYKLCSIAEL